MQEDLEKEKNLDEQSVDDSTPVVKETKDYQSQDVQKNNSIGDKRTSKAPLLLGGFLAICLAAGVTYFSMYFLIPREVAEVEQTSNTQKVENVNTVDQAITEGVDSEQEVTNSLNSAEADFVQDDAESTQTLEGSYGL